MRKQTIANLKTMNMDRETIEQAADKFATAYTGVSKKFRDRSLDDAFSQGAKWRIGSVWHDASEKPNKNQLVLFECRKTYGKGYSVNFGENYELMKSVIVRWAYIINLIPD